MQFFFDMSNVNKGLFQGTKNQIIQSALNYIDSVIDVSIETQSVVKTALINVFDNAVIAQEELSSHTQPLDYNQLIETFKEYFSVMMERYKQPEHSHEELQAFELQDHRDNVRRISLILMEQNPYNFYAEEYTGFEGYANFIVQNAQIIVKLIGNVQIV